MNFLRWIQGQGDRSSGRVPDNWQPPGSDLDKFHRAYFKPKEPTIAKGSPGGIGKYVEIEHQCPICNHMYALDRNHICPGYEYYPPKPKESVVSESFPHIERVGLSVFKDMTLRSRDGACGTLGNFVRAEPLEKLFAEGFPVHCEKGSAPGADRWIGGDIEAGFYTHTGLLIGIKPIVKDTAESLLKLLIRQIEHAGIVGYRGITPPELGGLQAIIERAKRLGGEK